MIQVEQGVKDRIEQELARVNRFIASLRREERPEELETGGDNTPLSETADTAHVVEEREIRSQLLTWLTDRAVELDRALRRIEQGGYGICARCDGLIHPERLMALPEATLCLPCQRLVEQERKRLEPTVFEWLETAAAYREGGEGE